jgi:hypothetical protein
MGDELTVRPVTGDDPYDQFAGAEVPEEYQPWKRPMTYVTFALGINAAGLLFMAFHPATIVFGWFAMGLGIGAVVCAGKEIALFAQAEIHPFIKWGKRTGWLGIVIGPLSAIVWIIILVGLGLRF